MRGDRLHVWAWVHRWSSILCTLFLLVLCLTGLPLLFGDEIWDLLAPTGEHAQLSPDAPRASLDPMVEAARRLKPDEVVTCIFIDPDEPVVQVHTAVSRAAANESPGNLHSLTFDAGTGALLGDTAKAAWSPQKVERFFFALHSQLLVGPTGLVVLGIVGLLFLVALVSGVVLYRPFMRHLDFGTVRRDRSVRVRRLDTHNLFGIVTLSWAAVVGFTGVLNEATGPLFSHWASTVVGPAAAGWSGAPLDPAADLVSIQAAVETARAAVPGMRVTGIDYPGATLNSARHYMVWARGKTVATAQLYTPVLIDAADGRLTAALPMPWYLRAIEMSRPFHFGNYGGMPLKVIWALFDIATIVVLVTGLHLLNRRRAS